MKERDKKAQVWVETVIYTLIGLAIIAILLAVVRPKIAETQDRLAIEQTIESLNNINKQVYSVSDVAGQRRIIDLKVSKGRFVIDAQKDVLYWVIDSRYRYSEPGIGIQSGDLVITTNEKVNGYDVEVKIDYKDKEDIRYNKNNEVKILDYAPSAYRISIENLGEHINFLVE